MPEGINDGIHKTTIESRELPLIDLGEFLKSDGSSIGELPEQIRTACENVGFFFITNHGVSADLIKRIFTESKRFHDLSFEKKISVVGQPKSTRLYYPWCHESTALNL